VTVYALDDEKLSLMLSAEAIREAIPEAELNTFRRVSEMVTAMNEKSPDVLFMDIEMPGMTGTELAEQVRKTSPQTQIVFVTGYGRSVLKEAVKLCNGWITKPVTPEQIRKQMEALFGMVPGMQPA